MNIDLKQIEELIDRYHAKSDDVQVIEVIEGVLGWGTTLIMAEGLKTAVIREYYLNEWSSGHTVRFWNKTPMKYLKLIERLEESEV